jgi:hypothetical protein
MIQWLVMMATRAPKMTVRVKSERR